MNTSLKINEGYWDNFHLAGEDLEFLYNHLLEIETPQTPVELIRALVKDRIQKERVRLLEQRSHSGKIFYPKENYQEGDAVQFPFLDWKRGTVLSTRPAKNPDMPSFDVICVEMEDGQQTLFASNLEDHPLNQEVYDFSSDDPNLDPDQVLNNYGELLLDRLNAELEQNTELVRIAGRWFPRALLVDVNIGYLNMAEALLDMEGGGPLTTSAILEQIELPTDVNLKLTEFSLNLALQEDPRFDEVGPSGEIQWFLQRLEPDYVRSTPPHLKYQPIECNPEHFPELIELIEGKIFDEHQPDLAPKEKVEEVTFNLLYPHWRSGTIPLVGSIKHCFPTAYEAPRVRFMFIDENENKHFAGWVVRNEKYACGLKDWYTSLNLIPGSILYVKPGKNPGEVIIRANIHRPTREWIRTALVGADGGVVFAMLKQMVLADYDERMVIAVPDTQALDKAWENANRGKVNLEKIVIKLMRELAKLNPQGHVNAIELYAVINMIRRCPPGPILHLLAERSWAKYLGDLYFRLDETIEEENAYA